MQIHRLLLLFFLSSTLATGQAIPPSAAGSKPASQAQQKALAEAQQKLQHGQTAAAIALLQPLADATPPVAGASAELGLADYRSGKLLEALGAFTQAEKENPNDQESIQLHGLTLYRLGRPAAAIPYLKRVRQWMPHADADANRVLGLCYLNSQQYEEARKTFALQYDVAPDSGAAYLLMANMLMQANLPEMARTAAQQALKRTPGLPMAHFIVGEVDLYKSDPKDALEEFERERAIDPAYPTTYDRLGDVYIRLGKYRQAQQALTKALSLDTSSTGPFILMGKVLLRQGDPQTAAMYLRHAVKMDPNNYISHTLLGDAYRGLGKPEAARHEIDIASKIRASQQLKLQPVR